MTRFDPIAIVGLGSLFPGAADLDAFWKLVRNADSAARVVPEGRWVLPADQATSEERGESDRVNSVRGCFLDAPPTTPEAVADRLRASGVDLDGLDPLVPLVLFAGHHAFESGRLDRFEPSRVGAVFGNIVLPTDGSSALGRDTFDAVLRERHPDLAPVLDQPLPGHEAVDPRNRYVAGHPATILARGLGLEGGVSTLDAACASSLFALRLAARDLHDGRLDAVIAGGVSRPDCQYTQMGFSQLRAVSRRGVCSPFDADGDGLVVGEGGALFALRRLADAEADGDTILGVIRGIGLSNDVGGSLLAPDSEGQLRAMREAYAQAGWSPKDVDLIECHATGTPLGDAVELRSLRALWTEADESESYPAPSAPCVVGSVKSNVGHLLTGAGAAGLTKVLLAFRHETLPPTAAFTTPNAELLPDGTPFRVLAESAPFPRRRPDAPRRAAVSAFGFGGINAHVLVEEWSAPAAAKAETKTKGSKRRKQKARPKSARSKRPSASSEPIAIVGIGGRLPGCADGDLRALAATLLGTEVELPSAVDRGWTTAGQPFGLTSKVPGFEQLEIPVGRYRIPPKDMPDILPQQWLALEAAADAFDHAAWPAEASARTGAFVGIGLDLETTNFTIRWSLEARARRWASEAGLDPDAPEVAAWITELRDAAGPPLSPDRTLGALGGIVASRIARELRLGGPCFTVSSEESSGLRALEHAVKSLRAHDLDWALVGGVEVGSDSRARRGHAATAGIALEEERSSDAAFGFVLRRLSDARADGQPIIAVLRDVSTAVGDSAEASALARARESVASEAASEPACDVSRGPLRNTGTFGAAEGLARVATAALALHHQLRPACEGTRTTALPWTRNYADGPRRAEVTLTGFEGQAGAALLEEAPDRSRSEAQGTEAQGTEAHGSKTQRSEVQPSNAPPSAELNRVEPSPSSVAEWKTGLFVIAGANRAALAAGLDRFLAFAGERRGRTVATVATEWLAATPLDPSHALALTLLADSPGEARTTARSVREWLDRAAPDDRLEEVVTLRESAFLSNAPLGRTPNSVLFAYPGSGNHQAGMGAALAAHFPGVVDRQDRESNRLRDQLQAALFWEQPDQVDLDDAVAAIFAQVTFGALMTDVLAQVGVKPAAVVGHSLGETTSYFATRTWRDRDAMLDRMAESPLFSDDLWGELRAVRRHWKLDDGAAVDWSIVVVDAPRERVSPHVDAHGQERAYLLLSNTPHDCVIGGDRGAVQRVIEAIEEESDGELRTHELHGVSAVHCSVVREVEAEYVALHTFPTTPPEGVRFYSTATGEPLAITPESAARSVTQQATDGFHFPRVIDRAYDDGARIFVEIGPRATATRAIRTTLDGKPHAAFSCHRPGVSEDRAFLSALAQLITERVPVDLTACFPEASLPRTSDRTITVDFRRPLPTTLRSSPSESNELPTTGHGDHADATDASETAAPSFSNRIAAGTAPSLSHSRLSGDPATSVTTPNPEPARSRQGQPRAPRPAAASAPSKSAPPPAPAFSGAPMSLQAALDSIRANEAAAADAHRSYLEFAAEGAEQLERLARGRIAALPPGELSPGAARPPRFAAETLAPDLREALAPEASAPTPAAPRGPRTFDASHRTDVIFDTEDCMKLAIGSLAEVPGPEFAPVDALPTRVRLPDDPLMLAHRIVGLEGTPGSLGSGRVITEHDIVDNAWYLDGGNIPVCIAVEAGQADLFLSGYLGIDLHTRGEAVYRLLDAEITFHDALPTAGHTIRYDIRIDRFFFQGETALFRFRFDATVNGKPLLTMRNGCAGFFTEAELAAGQGIVQTALDRAPRPGVVTGDWQPLAPLPAGTVESLDDAQVDALRRGDLGAAFGEAFGALPLAQPETLPTGRMNLVDRVLEITSDGGRFSLGRIRGELDIHPDDWFLTCHFSDDMVMPGTLMYECCLHTLRMLLIRFGWVGERGAVSYQPIAGIRSRLKCRGQVTATTSKVQYEVTLKEIGYGPPAIDGDGDPRGSDRTDHPGQPYVVADVLMYADDRPVVEMIDMSVRLEGLDRDGLEAMWANVDSSSAGDPDRTLASHTMLATAPTERPALFDREQILAYAVGNPSEGFGDPYRIFDEGRIIARLPGPPYLFLDRIVAIENATPFVLERGARIEGEYDVPPDAWYFDDRRSDRMSFAVLLEVALQPCGWLAAYLGSALTSETDLKFRNLGGSAVQHRPVTRSSGTLTIAVGLTAVSQSGGMIIQHFDLEVRDREGVVYQGTTYFGFFTAEALATQIGIRDVEPVAPSAEELERSRPFTYPTDAPYPQRRLHLVDEVTVYDPAGGPHGLGILRGVQPVDPKAWFFDAHFYQDPVCPGSLGLEMFLHLLEHRVRDLFGTSGDIETMACGEKHEWIYRGQYIPSDREVTVDVVITKIDPETETVWAEGFLTVDGRVIYRMQDFSARRVEE